MKAWAILRHSLRQVLGNLRLILSLSLVPILLQALVLWLVGRAEVAGWEDAWLIRLPTLVFTSLWIAVAFHRFILLEERPSGLLPALRRGMMLDYGWLSLRIGVVVWLVLVLVMILVAILFSFRDDAGALTVPRFLADTLIAVPVLAGALRLGTGLPGIAVGRSVRFTTGWRATRGATGDFLVLALLTVILISALQMIGAEAFSAWPFLWFLWRLAFGWFLAMLGFSILTTLYGHHIEGRRLV